MHRLIAFGAVALAWSSGIATAGGDKPNWMKWDAAKAQAAQTGLPILVYSVVDQKGGSC